MTRRAPSVRCLGAAIGQLDDVGFPVAAKAKLTNFRSAPTHMQFVWKEGPYPPFEYSSSKFNISSEFSMQTSQGFGPSTIIFLSRFDALATFVF
jgi:hypothetical protein